MIYLDACVLIYVVEDDAVFGEQVTRALTSAADHELAISSLVKLECLVKPIKAGNLVLLRRYERVFEKLRVLAITDEVFVAAAHLRARFGLRTPDALHLACAQHYGCEEIWTDDDRLARAGHGLARNVFG